MIKPNGTRRKQVKEERAYIHKREVKEMIKHTITPRIIYPFFLETPTVLPRRPVVFVC